MTKRIAWVSPHSGGETSSGRRPYGQGLAAFALVIALAGVLVSRFDKLPLGESIYFAFITAFTVGFGDVAPKSKGARVVTIVLSFFGLLLAGIVVAVAVHALDLALHATPGT